MFDRKRIFGYRGRFSISYGVYVFRRCGWNFFYYNPENFFNAVKKLKENDHIIYEDNVNLCVIRSKQDNRILSALFLFHDNI